MFYQIMKLLFHATLPAGKRGKVIEIQRVAVMARFLKLPVFLLGLVLVVSVSTSCGGVTQKPTIPAPPQEAEAPSPAPTEEPKPASEPTTVNLEVLSHSSYMKYGSYVSWPSGKHYKGHFFHIVGEFRNPGSLNVRLDNDKIEATFYDTGGSVIEPDFILKDNFAEEEILAPGEKWPFRLVLLDEEASHQVANYELVGKGHETGEVPHRAEVLSYGLFQNANLKLIGEVRNTADENIRVRVIATFYDEKGTVIAADGFLPLVVLAPGEKAPFWLLPVPTEAPGKVEGCEIVTIWSVSDVAPYREFEILSVVYQEGPEWSWKHHTIKGELKNSGKQIVTSVWVYATYYDDKGRVIDYSLSEVEPDMLKPGDKGSFELIAPPPPWEMPDYALLVKGMPLEKE